MNMEYIRSMNCNYERMLLSAQGEERYQYKMLERGGMKGLLDCSIRKIDGETYLYYDISFRQMISQMLSRGCITREWLIDFLSEVHQLQQTLYRFLLDMEFILWDVNHIFQDAEKNHFSFLYVPYFSEQKGFGDNHFLSVCSFLVEHVDYNDTALVDFVYKLYENVEKNEKVYMAMQLWEDLEDFIKGDRTIPEKTEEPKPVETYSLMEETEEEAPQGRAGKVLFGFPWKRKKEREEQERKVYEDEMLNRMENFVVAEPVFYEEEETRTVILNQTADFGKQYPYLMNETGTIMVQLVKENYIIGKASDKADICIEDVAASRMHCRILRDDSTYTLEDLNSTNGSFINAQRLSPYERRELALGDQIRCGNTVLFFR